MKKKGRKGKSAPRSTAGVLVQREHGGKGKKEGNKKTHTHTHYTKHASVVFMVQLMVSNIIGMYTLYVGLKVVANNKYGYDT